MQYKVPQDVQREDQILWFITLRQLIMLMVGGGLSYLLFVNLKASYDLAVFDIVLICIPFAISAALAFLKIKSIPLPQFFLLLLEQLIFRSQRRHWVSGGGEPFVSMTTSVQPLESQNSKNEEEEKEFDREKAEKLAKFLDNEKASFHETITS